MLTDTHAHLDFPEFETDLDAILERAAAAGVTRVITIGTSLEGSRCAIALAEKYPQVWAVVGVHPCSADEAPAGFGPELAGMAAHPKVVGIGEAGLDYYHLPEDQSEAGIAKWKQRQAEVFTEQLNLAASLKLNVVIHQRESWEDTVKLLAPYTGRLRAVFHCFGGTPAQVDELVSRGHMVSFTGIVTFKNAASVQASAAHVGAGDFMVETDCPYLAPMPFRGNRCEPAYTRQTAEKIATLRGTTVEEIARMTSANAERFFPRMKQVRECTGEV